MYERIEPVGSDAAIYLAARISRSSKSLKELIKELEELALVKRLIKSLFTSGHLSVFEHSFVRVHLKQNLNELRKVFFEFKYVELSGEDGGTASFNLRTALEMMESENKFLRDLAVRCIAKFPVLASILGLKPERQPDLTISFGEKVEQDGICVYPVIQSDHPNEKHAFFSFVVEGISRVCSHQFVRHRTLSFTQQSQRHVKPGNFYLPKNLEDDVINLMIKGVRDSFSLYEKLVRMGVKKEDARYVLSQASSTRVFVSGRKRAWNHFLDLRLDPSAQAEIRKVAKMISHFIRKDEYRISEG